jgi:hypothetical protein
MQLYTFERLNQLLGQQLQLQDDAGTRVNLTLDRVVKGKLDPNHWESFAAYLTGDPSFHIPQGNYQLEHPELGVASLFLSPKSEVEYELIMNRRLEQS